MNRMLRMLFQGGSLSFLWAAVVWFGAIASAQAAAQADGQAKLTAVQVQVTASDSGVVYQPYANRYVVGPNGWVEWKVTVKEKLAGFTEGVLYEFDKDKVSFPERKHAVVRRQEGDHTLVFRFEPGPYVSSGPLTFDRNLSLGSGSIRYYAVNSGDGQAAIKSTLLIDMSGVGGMANVQFKREYPTLSITPVPDDLRRSGQAPIGLSVDRIIVDVKDPVLDAKDFEFKYQLTAGMYAQSVGWATMEDRNFIPVPPEARGKGAHLTIEVRDRGGNWRPYTLFYPGPGAMTESRVTINPFDIFGGNVGDSASRYLAFLAREDFQGRERARVLQEAKSEFKYLQSTYGLPRNSYTWLAVFLYSTGQKSVSGYTGYADVDLANSGYLWSDSPKLPTEDLPVTPFSQTQRAVETNPLNGRQVEGHWGVVSSEGTSGLGEGTHYLYIKIVDAVTGGYTWQQVFYDADRFLTDRNASNFAPVKLIKDKTPPVIVFGDQPFVRGDYAVDTAVSDNAGLGAVQYMVSEYDFCARSPGACEAMGARWTDVPLGDDGRTANVRLDTAAFNPGWTGGFVSYVYIRAVELRHKVGSYQNDPFASGNSANIVTGMHAYYVLRGEDALALKATYVDRMDEQGRLASAPSHRLRLHTHAAGVLAAEGDVRYRIETAGGAVVQDWSTVPSGQELVLAGADGEYVLRAYALNAEGIKGSPEHTLKYVIGPAAPGELPSAAFSTTEMTNQDLELTLTSSVPIKLLNWSGIDPAIAAKTHTLTIKDSTSFDSPIAIQYQSDGGSPGTLAVSAGQIDKTGFGHLAGAGYIVYTPSKPTVGEVTAHLYVGKKVKPGSGDSITYRNGWLSYSFPANGEHVFEAEDAAGSPLRSYVDESSRKAAVTWIDNSAPAVSIVYSTQLATNKPVTATLQLPAGLTVINNGGSATYTFVRNGTFDFLTKDGSGVVREHKAVVANIDTEPPVITLDGPLTYPVYQGLPFAFDEPGYTAADNYDGKVTANVQVSNEVDVFKGGYYEIVYTVSDSAGNVARRTRSVSVMDMNGINLFVNGIRVRGDIAVPRGTLRFDIIGQESEELVFLYLPGKRSSGAFKAGGMPIAGRELTLNEPGWYTFFVQDRERRTFVGQINVQ